MKNLKNLTSIFANKYKMQSAKLKSNIFLWFSKILDITPSSLKHKRQTVSILNSIDSIYDFYLYFFVYLKHICDE